VRSIIILAVIFIFAALFFYFLDNDRYEHEENNFTVNNNELSEEDINKSIQTIQNIQEEPPPRERLEKINNYIIPLEIQGVYHMFLPHWANEPDITAEETVLLQGSLIPTIFITTESGGLDYIHADQNNRERVEFIFVDENGYIEHRGGGDINGRGNYTWLQPKRPYNFRLASGVRLPLFGLGEGRHWTLLANYLDYTRVRNIAALNLARALNISHTPRLRPVDVFINGEYAGIYDLVERRSINHSVNITDLQEETAAVNDAPLSSFPRGGVHAPTPGTIKYYEIPNNPGDISGGYLLEIQFGRRYMREFSGFVTDRGMAVNILAPSAASREQVMYIRDFFQQIEDAVYSPSGYTADDVHFSELLCIRAFAMKYIFQEFILDADTGITSFFMYKEKCGMGSGRLYPGPAWDLDLTLGNFANTMEDGLRDPHIWWANDGHIDKDRDMPPHILNALYRHDIFRGTVHEMWANHAAPVIRVLVGLDEGTNENLRCIDSYINEITDSRGMDMVRWPFPAGRSFSTQVTDITHFAYTRYLFLDKHWRDG